MTEKKRFVALIRKPEYLDIKLARTTDPNLFLDEVYTSAVTLAKAKSNIWFKYPGQEIIEIRETNKIPIKNPYLDSKEYIEKFYNEVYKIESMIKRGNVDEYDEYEFKAIREEANEYGVDNYILNNIIKLRKNIEG